MPRRLSARPGCASSRLIRLLREGGSVDANVLSAAIAIEWGSQRIVLAADLPGPEWAKVVRDLEAAVPGDHGGLKLPHHGSKSAQHDSLREPRDGRQRLWWLTPWNRAGKLPRFEDGEGLDIALRTVPSVVLTGLPFALARQMPQQAGTRSEVHAAITKKRFGAGDMLLTYEAPAPDPAEAWVRLAFDAGGGAPSVERGAAAWEILA